jgi:hypothetical protein
MLFAFFIKGGSGHSQESGSFGHIPFAQFKGLNQDMMLETEDLF